LSLPALTFLRVLSNTFITGRRGTPDVYLTFPLVVPTGTLLLQLSLALCTVQCTEGPTFRALGIFEFLG
jgi:hypothetical protein